MLAWFCLIFYIFCLHLLLVVTRVIFGYLLWKFGKGLSDIRIRYEVNSIPEFELMVNSGKNNGIGIDKFGSGIEVS